MSMLLDFHCGECAASLTDATALFTSCGHFFCNPASVTAGAATCTQLVAGRPGTCEQCGASCNAGVLTNKAKEYDDRVKKFVFGALESDLRMTADILEFRAKHATILRENAIKLLKENAKLRSTVANQADEIRALREECAALQAAHRDTRARGRDLHGVVETSEGHIRATDETAPLESKVKATRSIQAHLRGDGGHEPHEGRSRPEGLSEDSRPIAEQQARRRILGKRVSNADLVRRERDEEGYALKSARYHVDQSETITRRNGMLEGPFSSRSVQRDNASPRSKFMYAERSTSLARMDDPRKAQKLVLGMVDRNTIHRRGTGVGIRADEMANSRLTQGVRNGRGRENVVPQHSKTVKRTAPVAAAPWEYSPAGKASVVPSALSRFASSARSTPLPPSMARRATLLPSTGVVPRPSATPERFSRPARIARPTYNPLSAQK